MSSPRFPEPRSPGSRIEAVFTWLGGGHWRELGERHERSTHSVAGVVVLLGAMYLPIAAEAEAASRAAQLPAGGQNARIDKSENLPARVESGGTVEPPGEPGTPLIPTIPDVTKAAARWVRPLVPPFLARAIDTTTLPPLRAARQVFEEVEEITFSFRRTHRVTVNSEESPEQSWQPGSAAADTRVDPRRTESPMVGSDDRDYGDDGRSGRPDAQAERSPLGRAPAEDLSLGQAARGRPPELMERDGPRELRGADGPRQLPPAE